jgi:hypothetical protein
MCAAVQQRASSMSPAGLSELSPGDENGSVTNTEVVAARDLDAWCALWACGEAVVMAGARDEIAAGTPGRGSLRASHADREHVIGMLQAAFVQGRLTKDEFDERVGQTFASRTYAELAAVTADLPAGLAGPQPPPAPARATAQPLVTMNVRSGVRASMATTACAVLVWAVYVVTGNIAVFLVAGGATATAFVASFLTATQLLSSWADKRSGGQPPPRPAPGAGAQPGRRTCRRSACPGYKTRLTRFLRRDYRQRMIMLGRA